MSQQTTQQAQVIVVKNPQGHTYEYLTGLPESAIPLRMYNSNRLKPNSYYFDTEAQRLVAANRQSVHQRNKSEYPYRYVRSQNISLFYNGASHSVSTAEWISQLVKLHGLNPAQATKQQVKPQQVKQQPKQPTVEDEAGDFID